LAPKLVDRLAQIRALAALNFTQRIDSLLQLDNRPLKLEDKFHAAYYSD
jgi:hypothetical protein